MSATDLNQSATNDLGVRVYDSQKQNIKNHKRMAEGVNHIRHRINAYLARSAGRDSIASATNCVSRRTFLNGV